MKGFFCSIFRATLRMLPNVRYMELICVGFANALQIILAENASVTQKM